MPIEVFLVPMQGDGLTRATAYTAKYNDDPSIIRGEYIPYSKTTVAILSLEAPQTYLDSVATQSDATRLATQANIDSTINATQASTFKSIMDGVFVPDIVAIAGDTRRYVIRKTICMFLLSQRFQGLFGESWQQKAQANGITLGSTWGDFPQVLKDAFIQVRDSHGWGNLGLTSISTMNDILTAVINKRASNKLYIAGVTL